MITDFNLIMYKLYTEYNLSYKDISRHFRVSISEVKRRIAIWKVNIGEFALTEETLYRLYHDKGLSPQQISEMSGCSKYTIYRLMKKWGISLKEQSRKVNGEFASQYNSN